MNTLAHKLKLGLAALILICCFLPLAQCTHQVQSPDRAQATGSARDQVLIPAEIVDVTDPGNLFLASVFFWPLAFQAVAMKIRARRGHSWLNLVESLLSIGSVVYLIQIIQIWGTIRYGGILALSSYLLYFMLCAWLAISGFRGGKSNHPTHCPPR